MKGTAPAGSLAGALAPLEPVLARLAGGRVAVGLLGRGIGASRTPAMHRAEGRRLGLDYRYELVDFDVLGLPDEALGAALAQARAAGLAGVNVTHPFKQRVLPLLEGLSAEAAAIGAVNTVVFQGGRGLGHNTDCWGFAESLRRGLPNASLERVLLLGAGGAGLAVARALLDLGAGRIAVADPDRRQAEALVNRLGPARVSLAGDLAAEAAAAEGLVNATPVGMDKYPGLPLPGGLLHPALWVADVIYFPARTALIEAARALGCRTLTGQGMAIFQAVRAFELFSGRAPDPAAMAAHFAALDAPARSELT